MTIAMRLLSMMLAMASPVACGMTRTRCGGQSVDPINPVATTRASSTQPSVGGITSSKAEEKKTEVGGNEPEEACRLIARRLRLAARYRHQPISLFSGKAMRCERTCGRGMEVEDGFIGVGWPDSGPGAFFDFQLREDLTDKRLTCETIGLAVAASGRLEPGVEGCAPVKDGPLTGMTIILDSRCDRLGITLFDHAYQAADPDAGKLIACDKLAPERLAAPALLCGPLNITATEH